VPRRRSHGLLVRASCSDRDLPQSGPPALRPRPQRVDALARARAAGAARLDGADA